jgi:hypothetical protein
MQQKRQVKRSKDKTAMLRRRDTEHWFRPRFRWCSASAVQARLLAYNLCVKHPSRRSHKEARSIQQHQRHFWHKPLFPFLPASARLQARWSEGL